jgi:hypothetical protein
MILQNIAELLANHTASHSEEWIIQICGLRLFKTAHKGAEADSLLTNLPMDPHTKSCTTVILRFSSDPHVRHL